MIRIQAPIIRAQLTEAQTNEQRIVNAIAMQWKVRKRFFSLSTVKLDRRETPVKKRRLAPTCVDKIWRIATFNLKRTVRTQTKRMRQ